MSCAGMCMMLRHHRVPDISYYKIYYKTNPKILSNTIKWEIIKSISEDYTYSGWSDGWITPVLHTSHASTWNLMLYDGGDLRLLQLV